MPITGSETIVGLEGVVCEGAIYSLISVPQLCKSKSAAEFFGACGAVAVKLDDEGISTLNGFKETCLKNQLLLAVHLYDDSLYEINVPHVTVICKHANYLDIPHTPAVTCDMGVWTPSANTALIKSKRITYCVFILVGNS